MRILELRRQTKAAGAGSGRHRYAVIGPPESGKTLMLGVLEGSQVSPDFDADGFSCALVDPDPEMKRLSGLARMLVVNGDRPDKTQGFTNREFSMRVTQRVFGIPLRAKIDLSLSDAGGAALFGERPVTAIQQGDPMEAEIEAMRQAILSVEALMICVDGSERLKLKNLFLNWPSLMEILGQSGCQCKRVVMALTQADKWFDRHQENALELACTSDPLRALPALGKTVSRLYELVKMGLEVGLVWTSAFGFIEDTGYANYNAKNHTLRLLASGEDVNGQETWDPEAEEAWTTFRVMDAFIYLCTGVPLSVRVLTEDDFERTVGGQRSLPDASPRDTAAYRLPGKSVP